MWCEFNLCLHKKEAAKNNIEKCEFEEFVFSSLWQVFSSCSFSAMKAISVKDSEIPSEKKKKEDQRKEEEEVDRRRRRRRRPIPLKRFGSRSLRSSRMAACPIGYWSTPHSTCWVESCTSQSEASSISIRLLKMAQSKGT